MRLVTTVTLLTVTFLATSVARAQLPKGTLVRVVPQGIVIRTDNGTEVPFAISPTNSIAVKYRAEMKNLPDNTPCWLWGGRIRPGSQEIVMATLTIATPQGRRRTGGQINFMTTNGNIDFSVGVPGLFKKGPPFAFQVGQVEYVTRGAGGREEPTPPEKVGMFYNKVLPLFEGKVGNDRIKIEYDFGDDLTMAGANAKVEVKGSNDPAQATIEIERVEPLPKR